MHLSSIIIHFVSKGSTDVRKYSFFMQESNGTWKLKRFQMQIAFVQFCSGLCFDYKNTTELCVWTHETPASNHCANARVNFNTRMHILIVLFRLSIITRLLASNYLHTIFLHNNLNLYTLITRKKKFAGIKNCAYNLTWVSAYFYNDYLSLLMDAFYIILNIIHISYSLHSHANKNKLHH